MESSTQNLGIFLQTSLNLWILLLSALVGSHKNRSHHLHLKKKFVVKTIIPKDVESRRPVIQRGHRRSVKQIERAKSRLSLLTSGLRQNIGFMPCSPFDPSVGRKNFGIHHGSLDRRDRTAVENVRQRCSFKAVVCSKQS